MTNCILAKPGATAAGHVSLTFDDGVIKEAVAKDSSAKPRIREIPKAFFGDKPLTHLGSMILERIAAGYEVLREDQELQVDRFTSRFTGTSNTLVDVALRELLPSESIRPLLSGETVRFRGMLLTRESAGDQMSLVATFLRSALDQEGATLLAVLNRADRTCASGDATGQCFSLLELLKGLAQFEALSDTVLDRLQQHGLSLRPVDFRQIDQSMSGFVGI